MSKDIFREREKALENVFFEKRDRHLLDEMRAAQERDADRMALRRACGATDERLLDALLDHGVSVETIAALVALPLVMVAWADREMAPEERAAILDAAGKIGLEEGTAPRALLEQWLERRPAQRLEDAWSELAASICERLEPNDRAQFAQSMLAPAERVARAAGGILGIGPKISKEEREVLDRLASTFEPDSA